MLAVAAGGVEPGHSNPVALLDLLDAGTNARDEADTLMTGNEGRLRFHRPVALGCVQIRVTHARCLDLDLDLAGAGLGYRRFLDNQRLAEFAHNCGFHGFRHGGFLSSLDRQSGSAPIAPAITSLLRTTGGNRDRRGTSATVLITLTLVPFEAQSLRSHPLCFFIKCVNPLIEPSVLRLRCIGAPQFFKRFLNRELVDFSHCTRLT